METNLHSLETYLYKYLLPITFIPWDGFRSVRIDFPSNGDHARTELWLFYGFWLVLTPFVFWYALLLKRVFMDEGHLRVKGYLNEIHLPLADIESVRPAKWPGMRYVTMKLRSPSEFGDRIRFIPKGTIMTTSGRRSTLEVLRERINQPKSEPR